MANWIPERIEADAKLAAGARVRISVEAARAGYLYVIDREQYADGTLGEPYLIFPTTRTNAGNNEAKPGRVVEIPDQEDQPPFFTLQPSRPDQVGELLSVLVTTNPLEGLHIGDTAQTYGRPGGGMGKVLGGTVGRLELEDGAGKAWTKAEREAGADTTRALTRDAPAPQTLYYSPAAKSGQPVLLVSLRYGGNASAARPTRR